VGWVTGALGVAPVIAVVLGSALIDVLVVPSIAHLAVLTAAATPSPIKLVNSILGQGLKSLTRPTRPVISLMACLITGMTDARLSVGHLRDCPVAHVLPARWR